MANAASEGGVAPLVSAPRRLPAGVDAAILEAAVRGAAMSIAVSDATRRDNPLVFVNAAFEALTGYSETEVVGRNCRFLQGPDTDASTVRRIRAAMRAGVPVEARLLNYRKDGTPFWNLLHLSPLRSTEGVVTHFVGAQLNVTGALDRHEASEQMLEAEVRRRTADLEAALDEKALLLREVDHRVKNNLAMIGSLLRLQSRAIGDPALSARLDSMLARVDALASVHRRMYESDDLKRFDVGSFAADLAADVIGASGRRDILLNTSIEPALVDSSRSATLGLILNELLVNAVKHAFADGRPGRIDLWSRAEQGMAIVGLADDGLGFVPEPEPARPTGGFGRMLIARLARHSGATVTHLPSSGGSRFEVRLPLAAA